jgi:hypothetical protein
MKRKALSVAIIGILGIAFCVWLTGCSSLKNQNALVLEAGPVVAEVVAKDGTYYACKSEPKLIADFQQAIADLTILVSKDSVTVDELAAILQTFKIKEIKTPSGRLAVSDAVTVEKLAPGSGTVVSSANYTNAKPFALAIRDGISEGLAMLQ